MGVNNFEKMTKTFEIGDYYFTLGLNRKMAVEYFKKVPQYFENAQKLNNLNNKIANKKQNEVVSNEDLLEMFSLTMENEEYAKQIVNLAMPEMLAYGGNDTISDYDKYAKDVFEFCDQHEVLYNEIYNDDNGELKVEKGLYTMIVEFIVMGFTQGVGTPNKKPKLRIIMN